MVAETFRICICPEVVTVNVREMSKSRHSFESDKSNAKKGKHKNTILLRFPVLGHPVLNVLGDVLAFPLSHVHQENATIEYALLWP